jgi:hypothetical protein
MQAMAITAITPTGRTRASLNEPQGGGVVAVMAYSIQGRHVKEIVVLKRRQRTAYVPQH